MSQYVLDCSVAMRWLYSDEATPETDALYSALRSGQDQAFVPLLFFTELLNALLTGERRRRRQPDEADRFFGSVLGLPISVMILRTLMCLEVFGPWREDMV